MRLHKIQDRPWRANRTSVVTSSTGDCFGKKRLLRTRELSFRTPKFFVGLRNLAIKRSFICRISIGRSTVVSILRQISRLRCASSRNGNCIFKFCYRCAVTISASVFLLITFETVGAQQLSNIPGAFSEAGFGVRPSGMGEAYAALSNDANAFLTNPAGLLLGTRPNFTANYANLFGLVPSSYVGLLHPLAKNYALGGGFLFIGDDALSEYTLGVSFAYTPPNIPIGGNEIYFDQMSFGITLKGRWASFGNNDDGGENRVTGSGGGFGIDLGYIIFLDRNLSLGVVLRDLINTFHWNSSISGEYPEGVPATLRVGGAYNLDGLTIAFDLRKSLHDDTDNRAHIGVEKIFFDTVVLRAGFSNNLGTADLNRRWTFGMTFLQGISENYKVGISAAYRVGNVENQVRFGLDLSWGKPKLRPLGRVY